MNLRALCTSLVVTLALLGVLPLAAHAGTLTLSQEEGTRFVHVGLDTGTETINAIEGTIDLGGGKLSSLTFAGSVVPLWLERPSPDSLHFAGTIPGGFTGSEGKLFTMVVAGSGEPRIAFMGLHAYLNDGNGTPTTLSVAPLVTKPGSGAALSPDTGVPEFSEVRIARDPSIFDNAWFVTFNAQDGDSGVAGYEVAERPGIRTDRQDTLHWRAASPPVLLEDQSRGSTVFVRVHDVAGNERVFTIEPESSLATSPYAVLGGFALLILLLAAVVIIRRARVPKL